MKNLFNLILTILLILVLVRQYRLHTALDREVDKSIVRLRILCMDNPGSFLPERRQPDRTTAEYCRDYIDSLVAETGSK